MKKILVIDESQLLREFLKQKLAGMGFEVILGANGLDATLKLRGSMPDLIIMDYYLSRKSVTEVLEEKKNNPNTKDIPIIMASAKIDRDKLMEVAKYGVKKFFAKPLKIDALLKTVAELLDVSFDIDDTPCIIEAHFNDEILFVEIAQGLNREKIELLRYKITELVDLYEVQVPKVLVIMSNLELGPDDSIKLGALLRSITEYSGAKTRHVKVLTNSAYVKGFVAGKADLAEIEVTDNLEQAMDGLIGRKTAVVGPGGLLVAAAPRKEMQESFHLRFEGERVPAPDLSEMSEQLHIAVVDDDFVIQELVKAAFSDTHFIVDSFDNGRVFTETADMERYDLLFLDLMMPEMDGFATLKYLGDKGIRLPIIVLSALSKRETVVKALGFGVKSYLIKPLKPEWILKKTTEIIRLNF